MVTGAVRLPATCTALQVWEREVTVHFHGKNVSAACHMR